VAQLAAAALSETANENTDPLVQITATAPCSNSGAYIATGGQAEMEDS